MPGNVFVLKKKFRGFRDTRAWTVLEGVNIWLLRNIFREENHEQAEEEEGEDLVSKAETEFFKIVEAEKKALEEAENKRNAALAEVKQAIAQEGVTHEEYKEGEAEVKTNDEVTALSSPSYFPSDFHVFLSPH